LEGGGVRPEDIVDAADDIGGVELRRGEIAANGEGEGLDLLSSRGAGLQGGGEGEIRDDGGLRLGDTEGDIVIGGGTRDGDAACLLDGEEFIQCGRDLGVGGAGREPASGLLREGERKGLTVEVLDSLFLVGARGGVPVGQLRGIGEVDGVDGMNTVPVIVPGDGVVEVACAGNGGDLNAAALDDGG